MIEDPPILTIKRGVRRPGATQVAALQGVATGYLVDCMNGRGALNGRIKPIDPDHAAFCGVAITCDCGPADNLGVFGALDLAIAGDVILIATDAFESTAVIGDLVLGMMKNRGVVASVTDGYVRDIVGLRKVGLPCYAAGVTPNSPARNGPATAGLPISIGGSNVCSGDLVIGDLDGVVVVPFDRIDEVIATLVSVREAEAALDASVNAGLEMPEFASELLASDRVRNID